MTNQDPLIQTPPLDFSKIAALITGMGALIGAVTALIQAIQPGVNPGVISGALTVAAAGLLSLALVTAADVFSRAYVTAAQFKASPHSSINQSELVVTNTLTTMGTPFSVRVRGKGPESFTVLALGWDATTKATTYFIVRENERPMWVKEDDIEKADILPR